MRRSGWTTALAVLAGAASVLVVVPPPAHAVAGVVVTGPVVTGSVVTGSVVTGSELAVVPADGVLHLEGHGWGHGHGLSQWGAQGAALSGLGATAILDRSYPGTQQVVAPARMVRVELSADEGRDTVVWAADGLAVSDTGGAPTTLPTGADHQRWRATVGPSSYTLESFDGSGWQSYGGQLTGPVAFTDSAALVRVGLPDTTSRAYRGSVAAVRTGAGSQVTVDTLPLEDYLRGVVPRESPSSWQPAALQAQAVAARSYASYLADHAPAGRAWDLCDSDACQVYGGARLYAGSGEAPLEAPSTDAAVAATAGVVRTWQGAAIFAEFSSSDGGWSATGSQPYLAAGPDPYDAVDPGNVNHSWTATLPAVAVLARWPQLGRLVSVEVAARDGNGDWGGRVQAVALHGAAADGTPTSVSTTGASLAALSSWPAVADGLRSPWWHVVGAPVLGAVGRTAASSAAPPRTGLVAVRPGVLLDSGRSPLTSTAPRAVQVAGRAGVPAGALAALVTVVTSPAARAARLDAWAAGGSRRAAVALSTVARGLPSAGTALVPLDVAGALVLAPTSGAVGVRLTVTAYAAPGAPLGLVPAAGRTAFTGMVPAGASRAVPLPAPPAGVTAALLAVTTSAAGPGGRGAVALGGVAVALVQPGAPPVTTTVLVPLGGPAPAATVGGLRAHVRVDVVGWLAPGGAAVLPAIPDRAFSGTVGARGGVVRAEAAPAAGSVLALVTLVAPGTAAATAPTATISAHALPPSAAGAHRVALLAGAPVSALVELPLRDGRLVVMPAGVGGPVAVTVVVLATTPA